MYNVCVGGGEGGKHGVSTYESKGSNPEESFKREVSTYVRQVLARVKTFFGVGSQGSTPGESFKREVSTYVRQVLAWVKTFFGVGSLLETPVKQPPQVNEHNLFLFIERGPQYH